MAKLRVIQCGTGTAGREALAAILAHPQLQLVGLLVTAAAKAGQDAASLCGHAVPSGVAATTDFDAIVAMDADCVCYMTLVPDVGQVCRLLASGKPVVTTAGLMYPQAHDDDTAGRLQAACAAGRSCLFATGINPGWVGELLPLTLSALSRRIDHIRVTEYANVGVYPAPHICALMGFGHTPEAIAAGALPDLLFMKRFFRESVAELAAGLAVTLDRIEEKREFVLAPEDYRIAAGPIARGTVAGQRWSWTGIVNGTPRLLLETYWYTRFDHGEGWPARGDTGNDTQWRVTLEGQPSLRCTFQPRVSFAQQLQAAWNPSALATAMHAVHAIPLLCSAASPGIKTVLDFPIITGRYALTTPRS